MEFLRAKRDGEVIKQGMVIRAKAQNVLGHIVVFMLPAGRLNERTHENPWRGSHTRKRNRPAWQFVAERNQREEMKTRENASFCIVGRRLGIETVLRHWRKPNPNGFEMATIAVYRSTAHVDTARGRNPVCDRPMRGGTISAGLTPAENPLNLGHARLLMQKPQLCFLVALNQFQVEGKLRF